ncbi:MAG: hypothetical protein KDJ15_07725 [Alphaproteobacteria bacterium]|nr:hypothetical protein [Alphaproteobacteria bacterium]
MSKIVFLSEAMTLAHPARSRLLATALQEASHEILYYENPVFDHLLPRVPFTVNPLDSNSPESFKERLAQGIPLYDSDTIERYVPEERKILAKEKPDLVIGDFRNTLQISARLEGVPYLNLMNFPWSLHAEHHYEMPPGRALKYIGKWLGDQLFRAFSHSLIRGQCDPMLKARKKNGLEVLPPSIEYIYTDADYVGYLDLPFVYQGLKMIPENHRFIGPVIWEPDIPLPDWWNNVPQDKPIIYINLGSSGDTKTLPVLCQRLHDTGRFTLIVGTGTTETLSGIPDSVFQAPFLPGTKASERADIVICNGGSPNAMAALAGGAYCIGFWSNLDQAKNMSFLTKRGLGASFINIPSRISKVVNCCLSDPVLSNKQKADLAREFKAWGPGPRFVSFVQKILEPGRVVAPKPEQGRRVQSR